MAGIFDKFKEKKQNVVTSLREAADAVYLTVRSGCLSNQCSNYTGLPSNILHYTICMSVKI